MTATASLRCSHDRRLRHRHDVEQAVREQAAGEREGREREGERRDVDAGGVEVADQDDDVRRPRA
jgi:hypothetical protein